MHLKYFRKSNSNFKKKKNCWTAKILLLSDFVLKKMKQVYIVRVEKAKGREITHDNLSY